MGDVGRWVLLHGERVVTQIVAVVAIATRLPLIIAPSRRVGAPAVEHLMTRRRRRRRWILSFNTHTRTPTLLLYTGELQRQAHYMNS